MDDLTQIRGIGAATADKLVAAGIDSFAKLAAATTEALGAAGLGGKPADWQRFIDAGAAMAPRAERQLSDAEVAALVKSWDDARTELSAAGDAVADIQAQIEAKAEGVDPGELDALLFDAQDRVAKAHDFIAALTPLPEGVRLPDARSKVEIPSGPQGGPVEQAGEGQASPQAAPGTGEGLDKQATLEPGKGAAAPDADTLGAAFREELARQTEANGVAPTSIQDFARRVLAGPDGPDDDSERPAAVVDADGQELFPLTVIGPAAGRRRAGFLFDAVPRTVLVTAGQRDAIEGDGSLSATRGALPATADVAQVLKRLTDPDLVAFDGLVGCVTVIGPAKGRRRAGFVFGASPQTIEVDRDQLASLLSDPLLAVAPA